MKIGLDSECCFEINVVYTDQQPVGFEDWVTTCKFEKCRVTLPDGSSIDIRIYLDMSKNFDNGAFTQYLLNRYKETL